MSIRLRTVEWWESRANLALLAQHLLDELRADEIPYAIEKPWKYDPEFRAAERALDEEGLTA